MNGFQRVSSGLRSQIPDALVVSAAPRPRSARPACSPRADSRHLDIVLAVVHRDVQHRRRIHDRRQDLQRAKSYTYAGRAAPAASRAADDLEDACPQTAVVARDQVLHVASAPRRLTRDADGGVGGGEIDDDRLAQHDADERPSLTLERAELERRRRLLGEHHWCPINRLAKPIFTAVDISTPSFVVRTAARRRSFCEEYQTPTRHGRRSAPYRGTFAAGLRTK